MKRVRFSDEQILRILQEADRSPIAEVTRYQVGDVFHLQPNELHSEGYGPEGVTYLVSRKN